MKVMLIKHSGAMLPATAEDKQLMDKLPVGAVIEADIKQKRNYKYLKKFFAMINLGFEAFEPPEKFYKGIPAQKSLERFRKDVIIAAGYFDIVSNINGDVRAEARSISFGAMSEDEFNEVYSACCNVILQKVLLTYTKDDLDRVVDELIRF